MYCSIALKKKEGDVRILCKQFTIKENTW